jgi:hypothetical protein
MAEASVGPSPHAYTREVSRLCLRGSAILSRRGIWGDNAGNELLDLLGNVASVLKVVERNHLR